MIKGSCEPSRAQNELFRRSNWEVDWPSGTGRLVGEVEERLVRQYKKLHSSDNGVEESKISDSSSSSSSVRACIAVFTQRSA